jgi:hypothetical protein
MNVVYKNNKEIWVFGGKTELIMAIVNAVILGLHPMQDAFLPKIPTFLYPYKVAVQLPEFLPFPIRCFLPDLVLIVISRIASFEALFPR